MRVCGGKGGDGREEVGYVMVWVPGKRRDRGATYTTVHEEDAGVLWDHAVVGAEHAIGVSCLPFCGDALVPQHGVEQRGKVPAVQGSRFSYGGKIERATSRGGIGLGRLSRTHGFKYGLSNCQLSQPANAWISDLGGHESKAIARNFSCVSCCMYIMT